MELEHSQDLVTFLDNERTNIVKTKLYFTRLKDKLRTNERLATCLAKATNNNIDLDIRSLFDIDSFALSLLRNFNISELQVNDSQKTKGRLKKWLNTAPRCNTRRLLLINPALT